MSKEVAKQYVQNQIVKVSQILGKNIYDKDERELIKRDIFIKIKKYLDNFISEGREPRWVLMPGLRGVGKTTILSQIFFEYEKQKEKIVYFSLDEVTKILNLTLKDVLDAYQEFIGESFENLKKPIILLLDEVHYDVNWTYILKNLYDKSRRIFILATGSSAVSLNTNPDIARRALIEKLSPLKFTEYILIKSAFSNKTQTPLKGLSEELKDALFFSSSAEDAYVKLDKLKFRIIEYYKNVDKLEVKNYLVYGTMPCALTFETNMERFQILLQVISKVINSDIPNLRKFSIDVLGKMESILFMAASSDIISFTSLAKNLTDIDIRTLISIFDVLEKAEILFRIYPSGSVYKKVRKPSKYLFHSSALRASLLSVIDSKGIELSYIGKFVEDVTGMYFYREFSAKPGISITYDSSEKGADFILELAKRRVVIEVSKKKEELTQVKNTLKKTNGLYGLLITDSPLELLKNDNILKVPLEWFLLM